MTTALKEAEEWLAEITRKENEMENKISFREYIEGFIRNKDMPAKVAVEYAICQEVGKCLGLDAEEMREVAQRIDGGRV